MKSKLIIIVAVFILIVTVFLLFELHNSSKKEVMERFHAGQLVAVRSLAREIELYLHDRSRGVEILSTFTTLQKRDMNGIAATMKEYFEYLKKDHVKAISVYDEKGTIIYSTTKDAIGHVYAEYDFFQWAAKKENKGKQFVSSLIRKTDNQTGQLPDFRFLITAPIYQEIKNPQYPKRSNKFMGVVTATIDLKEVVAAFLPIASPYAAKEKVWIMDSGGDLLFQPGHPEMSLKNFHLQDRTCLKCHISFGYVETILNEREGTTGYKLKEGPKKLASFSSVAFKNISWKIVLNLPEEEISGFINKNLVLTFILIGVITLTLIAGSSLMYRGNRLKIRSEEEAKYWKEKRELENQISGSEEKFRLIAESSITGIYLIQDNLFVYVSPSFENIFGYRIDEIIGKLGPLDLTYPDDRDTVAANIRRRVEGEVQQIHYEFRGMRKDGSVINVEVHGSRIDFQGNPAVIGTLIDITDRKRSEDALNASEERQGLILRSLPVAIYTAPVEPEVDAFWISGNVFELTGYSTDEFVAETDFWRRRLHPEDRSRVLEAFERAAVLGEINIEYRWQIKNGQYKWFFDRSVRHEVGKKQEYFGVLIDITERKRAEESLKSSEEKFNKAFQSSPVAMSMQNAENIFVNVNNAFLKLTGYGREEVIGHRGKELRLWVDENEGIRVNDHFRVHGSLHDIEFKFRRKSGEIGVGIISAESILLEGKSADLSAVLDITERKRAEEALRENEERLRTIIETEPECVKIVDRDGQLLEMNAAGLAMLEVESLSEAQQHTLFNFILPEYRAPFGALHKRVMSGENGILEFEVMGLRGTRRWLETHAAPMRDAAGEVVKLLGVTRDITGRKRAEEVLRESEERFRNLVENINEVFYISDGQGKIFYCSPSITTATGYSLQEIIGKSFLRLVAPIDRRIVSDHYLEQSTKGEFDTVLEFRARCKDGKIIWAEQITHIVYDTLGNVVEYRNVARDITERKRAEGALRQAEEKYRSIFENAVVGIYQTRTDGQYVSANPTLALVLGYASPDELMASVTDMNHQFYVEPNRREEFIRLVEEQSAVLGFESQVYRKDGGVIWISETGRGIRDAGGNIIGFEGITIDITERKRAGEEIKLKNEQLIKLNSEKDKFFSIIAHDLRSPFQGFLAMTEMMAENSGEFTPEEASKISKEMNQSAENLFKLLHNLLEWAQLKKGSFSFTPEEFLLSKIVSASIEQINKRAIRKGITIMNEVSENQKVLVDERMANSIISNLLSNAVKFTRKEGKVTVKAKTISDGMVEIAVKDTGMGMSNSNINKLFKIDEKVGRKGTEGEESTGLGLLLCKEFIEKHGGKIWVESVEGKGSTFYFTLPESSCENS